MHIKLTTYESRYNHKEISHQTCIVPLTYDAELVLLLKEKKKQTPTLL